MVRSTRAIVETLQDAAEALTAYQRRLETVPLPDGRSAPVPPVHDPEPPPSLARPPAPPRPRSSRPATGLLPAAWSADDELVLALPQPDWLFHHLSVTGPADEITRFREAALGPGILPWAADLDQLEEDLFLMLMREDTGQRALSAAGAHVLAAKVRQVVERRDAQAAQTPRCVPFDLHALLPVPGPVLDLGADHPQALRWLWRHWGTTRPLRDVTIVQAGQAETAAPVDTMLFRVAFWSADWTPWSALRQLGTDWLALRFQVQPRYDVG